MTTDEPGARIDAFLLQRFEPAWTDPAPDQAAQCRTRVEDAARELARDISARETYLRDLDPEITETLKPFTGETADWNLAVLRALRQIKTETENLAGEFATDAGMHGANFPDLGAAWGITRQGARKRWPHAVSALNPAAYRGRDSITFDSFGGDARVSFHPHEGGWWWIATAANGQQDEAPDDVTYDTSEEASAAAGAFLAANRVPTTPAITYSDDGEG